LTHLRICTLLSRFILLLPAKSHNLSRAKTKLQCLLLCFPISPLLLCCFSSSKANGQTQLLSPVYYLCNKAVVVLHLHKKTNKCTYVKCVYHMLFLTDMFRSQSQITRSPNKMLKCKVNHSLLQSTSQTSYIVTEYQLINYKNPVN
jgi:hypothetical protein